MTATCEERLFAATMASPVGRLHLWAREEALVGVEFEELRPVVEGALPGERQPLLERARAQLAAYFAGERTRFELPLRPGGTPFQERVWAALAEIPYGETRSYGQLAHRVGSPAAVRAVGAANGRNRLALVLPCHRVIGADGTLTGYAGGLARKAWLLEHERRHAAGRGAAR